mgnify:CR=1 FL=1
MRKNDVLKALKGCLIVSCQANEGEPMNGYPLVMQAMAKAVIAGGAKGIRANTPSDIQSIRAITDLPIIGIYKQDYADSEIYITPTFKEVEEVIEAGSDIVALDGTLRKRPNGETLESIIAKTKEKYPEIVKIPEKADGILGAIIAGFIAGAACVLGLLKIIDKD